MHNAHLLLVAHLMKVIKNHASPKFCTETMYSEHCKCNETKMWRLMQYLYKKTGISYSAQWYWYLLQKRCKCLSVPPLQVSGCDDSVWSSIKIASSPSLLFPPTKSHFPRGLQLAMVE